MSSTKKSLTVAAIGTTVLAVSMLGLPSQAATGGHHTSAVRGDNASQHSPGAYDARKNIDGLITAYSLLAPAVRREHQLLIASKLDELINRIFVTALGTFPQDG